MAVSLGQTEWLDPVSDEDYEPGVTEPLAPGDTIGFVGLGNMGVPMSALLADAGYAVRGYDVAEAARARVDGGRSTAWPPRPTARGRSS